MYATAKTTKRIIKHMLFSCGFSKYLAHEFLTCAYRSNLIVLLHGSHLLTFVIGSSVLSKRIKVFFFHWFIAVNSISQFYGIFHSLQVCSPTFGMLTQSATWTFTFHCHELRQATFLSCEETHCEKKCYNSSNRHHFYTKQPTDYQPQTARLQTSLLLTRDVTNLPSNRSRDGYLSQ